MRESKWKLFGKQTLMSDVFLGVTKIVCDE